MCLILVYVCFVFCLCTDWFYGLTSERVYSYRRRVLKRAFAYDRVCPEVTPCGWQDINVQLLTWLIFYRVDLSVVHVCIASFVPDTTFCKNKYAPFSSHKYKSLPASACNVTTSSSTPDSSETVQGKTKPGTASVSLRRGRSWKPAAEKARDKDDPSGRLCRQRPGQVGTSRPE